MIGMTEKEISQDPAEIGTVDELGYMTLLSFGFIFKRYQCSLLESNFSLRFCSICYHGLKELHY